jgi:hypothetical protein
VKIKAERVLHHVSPKENGRRFHDARGISRSRRRPGAGGLGRGRSLEQRREVRLRLFDLLLT